MLHSQATTQAEVEALIKNILNIHPCLREEELILKVMANTRSDWTHSIITVILNDLNRNKEIIRLTYSRINENKNRFIYFPNGIKFIFGWDYGKEATWSVDRTPRKPPNG